MQRPHRYTSRHAARIACAALGMTMAWSGQAGDWTVKPTLTIDETFTDNVRLTRDDERSDFVTSVRPGISIRGQGARLNTNIDYTRQEEFYGSETRFNTNHDGLQGDVHSILLPNWLFFDVSGRMTQQAIDSRHYISRLAQGNNLNLADVISYEFTPRIEHTYSTWGTIRLSYSNQTVDRSNGQNSLVQVPTLFNVNGTGSTEDDYKFEFESGARSGRLPFTLSAESRKTTFNSGRVTEFKTFTGSQSYVVTDSFRFIGTGGTEANSFDSRRGAADGPFWSVGGRWAPSPRTSVQVDWGHRFFGSNLHVSARHDRRRLHFKFNYGTDVRTSNQYERGLQLIPLLDASGQPVFDPITNNELFVPVDAPGATDDVFVVESMNGEVGYTLPRGDVRLRYVQNKRTFQGNSARDSEIKSLALDIHHTVRPRLRANFSMSWNGNSEPARGLLQHRSGNYYSIRPNLEYDLGPHTTARLMYNYNVNDGGRSSGFADPLQSKYIENAITAALIVHM